MINKSKNKDMGSVEKSTKSEFFFAGGGEYQPMTVTASNSLEAQEIWEKERINI